jgi:predicted GIY-YIG superfamily endonuclease
MAINGGLAVPPELAVNVERYAVYRCYADDGQLLYVGETGELGTRFASHAQKLWFTQVRGITLEWYADELDALNAERRAIHIEHPKYNIAHRNTAVMRRPAAGRRKARRAPAKVAARPVEELRAQARTILYGEPGISGAQLAERLGMSERWGQLRKKEFGGHVSEDGRSAESSDAE